MKFTIWELHKVRKLLSVKAGVKLGLSATPERYFDAEEQNDS